MATHRGSFVDRSEGVEAGKKSENLGRKPLQQINKRPALAVVPSGLRVQPSRAAKQAIQDVNSNELQKQKATKKQPFVVYTDEAVSDEDKENKSTHPLSQNLQNKISVHSVPVENLKPQDSHLEVLKHPVLDDGMEECGTVDSPMIVDTSLNVSVKEDSDIDNILEVTEYADDIYKYLRDVEVRVHPKPSYMKIQPDITPAMRSILVDWLVEVAEEYKLCHETLFLSIAYIDKFLSSMSVVRNKLQLVGTASMYIAAKFQEIYPPDVNEFVYITDDTYSVKQVLRMEHLMLKVLSFDLAVPTIHSFLLKFASTAKLSGMTLDLAQYLCELSLLEDDPYLKFLPSVIAGASLCLANHTLNSTAWSEDLVTKTGYTLEDLRECVHCLYSSLCNAPKYPQQAVREKYQSSKFHAVSTVTPPSALPC